MPDRLHCLLGVLLTLAQVQSLNPTSQLRLLHQFQEHLAVFQARKSSGGNESWHDRDTYRDAAGRLVDLGHGGTLEQRSPSADAPNATAAAAENVAVTAAKEAAKEVLRNLGILKDEPEPSQVDNYTARLKPHLHDVEVLPDIEGRDFRDGHIEVVDAQKNSTLRSRYKATTQDRLPRQKLRQQTPCNFVQCCHADHAPALSGAPR